MAKRFSDTDKWKKPFIRGLQGPYKLLWFYILDDCDHAGIWHVDFEVAEIRIGEKIEKKKAEEFFLDKIEVLNNGSKWFIKDFIDFQYGELKDNNRLHVSVINLLQKNKVGACKPLVRGQGQEQGQGQGIGQGQEQGTEETAKDKLSIFEELFNDQIFVDQIQMTHKGKDIRAAFEECYTHHSNAPNPPRELWQWKQKLNTWLTIKGNSKQTKNGKQPTASTTEDWSNIAKSYLAAKEAGAI